MMWVSPFPSVSALLHPSFHIRNWSGLMMGNASGRDWQSGTQRYQGDGALECGHFLLSLEQILTPEARQEVKMVMCDQTSSIKEVE